MARNRELSQLGSIINVKDSNQNIGIGTTNPAFKFDVHGDINSTTEVRVKSVGVSTGTGNRWGFYRFSGGHDGIVGRSSAQPIAIVAYSFSSGTSNPF